MVATEHEGNILRGSLWGKHIAFHCVPEVCWDAGLVFTIGFFAEFFQADYSSVAFHYYVVRVDYGGFHETTGCVNLAVEVLSVCLFPDEFSYLVVREGFRWVMAESDVVGVKLQLAERYLLNLCPDFLIRRYSHFDVEIFYSGLF